MGERTTGQVKKCHMKCMKQEEMHEFVEDMCDLRDEHMDKEGEYGNDMKGNNYGYGEGEYGNKPEGEGEGEGMKSRKRRSCNGGPPEQCQWYIDMYGDGEDDDEQPEGENDKP